MRNLKIQKHVIIGVICFVIAILLQINNNVSNVRVSNATFGDISKYIASWVGVYMMVQGVLHFVKAIHSWLTLEDDDS